MPTILHRWRRAGYSKADIQGMYYAGQLMKGNIGPQIKAVLDRYGFDDKAIRWVSDAFVLGKSEEQIMLELYDQPFFIERFPAIKAREEAGLSPISADDYLQYEQLAESLGSTWGLRLSKEEVDGLLTHDVSPQELEQRFNIAAGAVFDASPETRAELDRLFGVGVTHEDIMRYWMSPQKELGRLQQKYRMGQIGGAALRTGYGQVDEPHIERLMGAGLDEQGALQGFSTLAHLRNLFTPIHGGESVISRDDQIDFLTGNVDAVQAVERRARQRLAQFAGRSGFAPGREGFTTGATTQA